MKKILISGGAGYLGTFMTQDNSRISTITLMEIAQ